MNKDILANIFGLHIGCKIRLEEGEERLLVGINQNIAIVITKDSSGHVSCLSFDECKLILKPLSSISEEDKVELGIIDAFLYHNEVRFEEKGEFLHTVPTCNQILWLASKGFDVGIVPDEYKIVREK